MTYRQRLHALQFLSEERVGAAIRRENALEDARFAASMGAARGAQ